MKIIAYIFINLNKIHDQHWVKTKKKVRKRDIHSSEDKSTSSHSFSKPPASRYSKKRHVNY